MRKRIILVEDNIADAELVKIAIKENLPQTTQLYHAPSGHDLFDYLMKANLQEIGVILLDLNMPQISGIEVLQRLRKEDRWKLLPVVIFSSSANKIDVIHCYESGANAYVCKPLDITQFSEVLAAIVEFWMGANILPRLR